MEKIKLSKIKELPEYRAIIPVTVGNEIFDIKVLNPKGELFDELFDVTATLLENESVEAKDGRVVDEATLMPFFIEKLTNIDIDNFKDITLDDNVALLETISAIQQIHSDMIIKAQINLTSFYNMECQRYHALKLEQAYTSFLEQKDKNDKEENIMNKR